MRTLTIEYGSGAGGMSGNNAFDVVNEYGQRCDGLCMGEMLEQVVGLALQGRPRYAMHTPEGWEELRVAQEARGAAYRNQDEARRARIATALRRLYDVSAGMDAEIQDDRPTEEEYQAAMREAQEALQT